MKRLESIGLRRNPRSVLIYTQRRRHPLRTLRISVKDAREIGEGFLAIAKGTRDKALLTYYVTTIKKEKSE
jgi:hypothetical protein